MEAEYSTFWLDLTPVLYEPGDAKVTKVQIKGISNSGHFAYFTKTKKPRMADPLCAYDAETDCLAIITEQGKSGDQHDQQARSRSGWV